MAEVRKKKILLLATGGTIACVATDRGFVPGITGRELLAQIPELAAEADFIAQQLMNKDSSEMEVQDWITIASAVSIAQTAYDGVVITHGTDTMCYTAAALSFMLRNLKIPVLLTGSQKPSTVEDSDGPDNLESACRFVLEAEPGVAIAFNRKLIHGVRAFKMYTKNKDAYVSRNYPVLAELKDGQIVWHRQLKVLRDGPGLLPIEDPDKIFQEQTLDLCENVGLLKLTPATQADILNYYANSSCRALVIEGFGAGGIANLTRGMAGGIKHLIDDCNISVVMISQCTYEGVNLSIYGVGEVAKGLGVIPGNDMTTEVAVTKLMWILSKTTDPVLIREMVQFNYLDEIAHD
ncbi:MAG: asparaginase [Eubacteriales bacterium]|nr:asparaginase [Eubacteriales bacterium]